MFLSGIEKLSRWDMAETKPGGPFKQILDHDIFVNDIYLSSSIPPFLTKELIEQVPLLSPVAGIPAANSLVVFSPASSPLLLTSAAMLPIPSTPFPFTRRFVLEFLIRQ